MLRKIWWSMDGAGVMAPRKAAGDHVGSWRSVCCPVGHGGGCQQRLTFRSPLRWRQYRMGAGTEPRYEASRQLPAQAPGGCGDGRRTKTHYFRLHIQYMPFFDSSNRTGCLSETVDAISMLEELMADHPVYDFVIGGDFNSEFSGVSPFDNLWKDCISNNNLVCCDRFINNNNGNNDNNNYTYIHQTLNQTKWNDHFFVSSSLVDASSHHFILDDGDNVSDHLPLMMNLACNLGSCPPQDKPRAKQPSLRWEKCSEEQKLAYNRSLRTHLHEVPSLLPSCTNLHCKNESCHYAIQAEYNRLVDCMQKADRILPRHKPGIQKSWWTDDLSSLRQKNIDIHRLWQMEGAPRSGDTNSERLRVKAEYKRAIRNAQRSPKQSCWNRLHGAMCAKNTTKFWRSWKEIYNKNPSHLHSVVNGVTDKEEIVKSFSSHFAKVSQPNNTDRVEELKREFECKHQEAVAHHVCDCKSRLVTLDQVLDATFSLKKGKSVDDDKISAEHFFNAPLDFFDMLQHLFNSMLRHAYVPSQFRLGTIIPLVKDRHGDNGDMNNYRGITIAPIYSKVFEHVLRILFNEFLSTSSYQFGFNANPRHLTPSSVSKRQ